MVSGNTVVVTGLAEFRTAVRLATAQSPKAISSGLKAAGAPILAQVRATAPGRVGTSVTVTTRGPRADLVSRLAFQGGSEWGQRGKWAGWVAKYGAPPRFVYPAIEARADEVSLILMRELEQVITIMGWAH